MEISKKENPVSTTSTYSPRRERGLKIYLDSSPKKRDDYWKPFCAYAPFFNSPSKAYPARMDIFYVFLLSSYYISPNQLHIMEHL